MSLSGNLYLTKRAGTTTDILTNPTVARILSSPGMAGALAGTALGGLGGYLTSDDEENPWRRAALYGAGGAAIGGLGGRILRDGIIDRLNPDDPIDNLGVSMLRGVPSNMRDTVFSTVADAKDLENANKKKSKDKKD